MNTKLSLQKQTERVRSTALAMTVEDFYYRYEHWLNESLKMDAKRTEKKTGVDFLVTAVTTTLSSYITLYNGFCIAAVSEGLMDRDVQEHIRNVSIVARKRKRLGIDPFTPFS